MPAVPLVDEVVARNALMFGPLSHCTACGLPLPVVPLPHCRRADR
jgi:hypothetical protein